MSIGQNGQLGLIYRSSFQDAT